MQHISANTSSSHFFLHHFMKYCESGDCDREATKRLNLANLRLSTAKITGVTGALQSSKEETVRKRPTVGFEPRGAD